MTQAGMDWHGVYKDMLFGRGTINPPCTHLKADDAKTVLPDGQANDAGLRRSTKTTTDGVEGDQMPSNPASLVQDFLSGSPRVRKRGCRNISCIFRALGSAVDEFLLFLQEFEEGEDDEDVLATLCNELRKFFDGRGKFTHGRDECPYIWAGGLSIISSLLLRIMLHRDKELQTAALQAFSALVSTCDHVELLGNKVVFQVLELCEDKQSAPRQAAAALIPALLHCTRRCSADLLSKQRVPGTPEDSRALKALLELKRTLFASYVALCGDKSCSVQLAAGQQLPLFVDYVAAETEVLQQGLSTQHVADDVTDGSSDGAVGELMVAVYTATQKFTLSLHESCRMQGVAAIAAMARRNAAAFRAVGNNFFPLLCSDSSWRVRATVCLALEDLALLSCNATHLSAGEVTGVSEEDGKVASMTASLFKFLTDRSPMVKLAALHVLPRLAQYLGSTAFVGDPWMLELHHIAEASRESQGCRLPGACLDAVIGLLPLSTGLQRRAFLELAMDLVQRGNWKLKISFLGSLDSLSSQDIALVSSLISSGEFATDEDGEVCWRVQAALAQQLPLLLRTVKHADELWWELLTVMLLSPTWAVRQEAGFAIRSIAEDEYHQHHAMPRADSVFEQRLVQALQQAFSCKNAFIRQDVAFYIHQIWDYLPIDRVRIVVLPLLQSLLNDPAPCCRLGLVKLLGRLVQKERNSQSDLVNDLKQMMETLLRDQSAGVREEALELQDYLELRFTPTVN